MERRFVMMIMICKNFSHRFHGFSQMDLPRRHEGTKKYKENFVPLCAFMSPWCYLNKELVSDREPQLNRNSTVQECDATMLIKGQMPVTKKIKK
jgi:hypothetical protein